MYYKRELKAELKKLKTKNDFAYQAGVNDALDLLDEMSDFIVMDELHQEITQEVIQQTTQQVTQPLQEQPAQSSFLHEKVGDSDFSDFPGLSGFEKMTKVLSETPLPQPVKLEIPKISSNQLLDELETEFVNVEDNASNVDAEPIRAHPAFQGWANSDEDEEEETERPVRTHEAADEMTQQVTQESDEVHPQERVNESDIQEKPQTLPLSREAQSKLEEAQLLAQARAQALRDAQENDEEEEDD